MTCYPEFPQAVPIRKTKQLGCLRGAFKDFTSGDNEGGDERNEGCLPLLTLQVRAALLYSCVCLTTPTTKSQSPLKNKVCLSAARRYLPVSPGRWASCMGLLSSGHCVPGAGASACLCPSGRGSAPGCRLLSPAHVPKAAVMGPEGHTR